MEVGIEQSKTFILYDKTDKHAEDLEHFFSKQDPSVNLIVAKTPKHLSQLVNATNDVVCILFNSELNTNQVSQALPLAKVQRESKTDVNINRSKNDTDISSIINTLEQLGTSSLDQPSYQMQETNALLGTDNLKTDDANELALRNSAKRDTKTATRYADALTPRQVQVLSLVSKGHSNKKIANKLELAESTVKVYCRDIFRILDVGNRTQAAVRANELALV